jgi:hypothetical protein
LLDARLDIANLPAASAKTARSASGSSEDPELDVMRRKQDDAMAELLDPAAPVVCGTAGLHHDRGYRLPGEEGQELISTAMRVSFGMRGSFLCLDSNDSRTSMPIES